MSNKDLAKIKLIYEFNNNSPLFARVAESLLEDGQYDEAIDILEDGLKKYPNYMAAKIVLILALAKKGEYEEVNERMDKIKDDLDEETINHYLKKIEEEREKEDELMSSIRGTSANLDDDLEKLAERISKAKIPPPDELNKSLIKASNNPKGNQFVSETLAEIYLAQGNHKEALEIYKKLLESNPQKSEQIKMKIEEINNLMNK